MNNNIYEIMKFLGNYNKKYLRYTVIWKCKIFPESSTLPLVGKKNEVLVYSLYKAIIIDSNKQCFRYDLLFVYTETGSKRIATFPVL